jgi:hypothetical protein
MLAEGLILHVIIILCSVPYSSRSTEDCISDAFSSALHIFISYSTSDSAEHTFMSLDIICQTYHSLYILWHVDPLLGNDREVSKYTTAVTR